MPRPMKSMPFQPSLLGCAIAASLMASPVQAVDLCAGKSAITIAGALPGDTCTVDTAAATLVVPSGQVLDQGVEVTPDDVTVGNGGSIRNSHVVNRSDSALTESHSMAALHVDNNLSGSIANTGTISVDLDIAAHATGTSTSGLAYYDARLFATVAGAEVMGDVNGQIVNSGTISASIDASVDAASGSVSGLALGVGLSVRGNIVGSVVNNGQISVDTLLRLSGSPDYDPPSGEAWAVAMGAVGGVSGTLANNGQLTARADATEDTDTQIRAVGMLASGVTGRVENTDSIDVSGALHHFKDLLAGIRIGFDSQPPGGGAIAGAGGVSNSGRIGVRLLGDGNGTAHGVLLDRITDNGLFENTTTGVIAVTGGRNAHLGGVEIHSMLADARASNAGEILLSGAPVGEGVDILSMTDNARFENSGRLDVSLLQDFGALGRGVSVGTMSGSANVANSGDIAVTSLSKLNSADAVAVHAVNIGAGATLENSGDLRAVAGIQYAGVARATGVQVGQLDGALNNLVGGTISARVVSPELGAYPEVPDYYTPPPFLSGSALAILVGGGSGQVSNSGVIDGGVLLEGLVSLENNGRLQLPLGSGAVVGGNYSQGADGVLQLVVRDAQTFSGLGVEGTADFGAGGRIEVQLDSLLELADADRVEDVVVAGTLLTPAGGLAVTDSSLFWSFDASVDGNTLDLVAHLADAGAVLGDAGTGLSPEQVAFARELLAGNLDPDFAPLLDALNSAPDAATAADLIESAGPAVTGAAGFAARSALQGASGAVSARLAAMRGEGSGDAFTRNAVWIKPFVGTAEQDSVDGVDGYDVATGGFILGVDGDLTDSWRVGAAVAAAQSSVEAPKADIDVDSLVLSLYGSYAINETAAIDLDASHVGNGFDSSRRIIAAASTARADYDGRQVALGVRVSNRIALGERAAFVPSAQVRYNRFMLDGYSETGAGALNLTVAQQTETSLQWLAAAGFEFGAGPGTLMASLGAGYDTLDAGLATASFAGGGPLYVSNGIKPDSTVVTGGVGYRLVVAGDVEIAANYDAESRGGDFLAQTLAVKFRMPF